jgi:hypothetical protein
VFLPCAGHGDLLHEAPELYARTVVEFCREAAASGRIGAAAPAPESVR